MMRSIIEYHNTDQTLDGDIKDVSIVGNELSTFHLTVESKGFLSAIRVLGLLILFLTSITITFFCYTANYKQEKVVDSDDNRKKRKRKKNELVIDSQQGVNKSDDVIITSSSSSCASSVSSQSSTSSKSSASSSDEENEADNEVISIEKDKAKKEVV